MNKIESPSESIENLNRVIRLKPQNFIHILDNITGITRLEVGPKTITLHDHERSASLPQPMIIIPIQHYCIVLNPVLKDESGHPIFDVNNQARLNHGDQEIRFSQEPFPLYPGEIIQEAVTKQRVIERDKAFHLRAVRDFIEEIEIDGEEDVNIVSRRSGDEWLLKRSGTYIPRIEVEIIKEVEAIVIKAHNQALHLKARRNFVDHRGNERQAGEEWLIREAGFYLPEVEEEVISIIEAKILTENKALHLKARRTFKDIFGRNRKAGDEWLVTSENAETHISDVHEEIVREVEITTIGSRQWCIVLNPVDELGRPKLGVREIRKGRDSFFLHPGESLEKGIQEVYVLGDKEALLLKALESFNEVENDHLIQRQPGDLWMIKGPREYVPNLEVEIVEKRKATPLDKNEGLYIRNIQTGEIKLVRGPQVYLLDPNEELWKKELSYDVWKLLTDKRDPVSERSRLHSNVEKEYDFSEQTISPQIENIQWDGRSLFNETTECDEISLSPRDETKAITFNVPKNAVVQIHDYKANSSRTVFGTCLVMLEPSEEFTVLSLSGSKPKKPNIIHSLALLLGPDSMTDILEVKTSDHVHLKLTLSYSWEFKVDRNNEEEVGKMFQVIDFVGDACKSIASRIRGSIAKQEYEHFHRNSTGIIREAVFGQNSDGSIRDEFHIKTNNLVITDIDLKSVDAIDENVARSLAEASKNIAEQTTRKQEAATKQAIEVQEQEARASLERQKINDQNTKENERRILLESAGMNAEIEAMFRVTSEAKAKVESERIKGELNIQLAQQEINISKMRDEVELAKRKAVQENQLAYKKMLVDLEIEKTERMAEITSMEFRKKVEAIGTETIKAIAQAGPEMQAKLLGGLGIQSVLITDGKNPVNLFDTAIGLITSPKSELPLESKDL